MNVCKVASRIRLHYVFFFFNPSFSHFFFLSTVYSVDR